MDTEQTHTAKELQRAFALFNDIAGSLQQSYQTLEQQTQALREELLRVQSERRDERRKTRRITRKLENLLQCLPGGVVLLDSQGYVEDCNPAAEDILGTPLCGELWLNVIDRAFAPKIDDGHEISLRDGRRISLATRSLDISADTEPGQLILLTDQTDTRRLQDKLHHNERLIEMGRMMAALAHQLRTPLSSATLYASHLRNGQLDAERTQKFSAKVLSQLGAIEQQIRDMLVFARSDLPISERCSVSSLLAGLEDAMQASLEQSEASYTLCPPAVDAELICNREVLTGALMNLVLNSLQSRPGVHISIAATAVEGDCICLSVCDDGPGFDADSEQPFFSSKPQGTGLGLAVVRAVVAAHQGRFELRSQCGEGTQARVILPLSQTPQCNDKGV